MYSMISEITDGTSICISGHLYVYVGKLIIATKLDLSLMDEKNIRASVDVPPILT